MKTYQLIFLLLCFSSGCDQLKYTETNVKKEKKSIQKPKDGLLVNYRADGKVLSEVHYKDNQLHGLAKNYYKDGTIHQEIYYEAGIKHGNTNTYYENGNMYRSTPYKYAKIDGIQKWYRKNGDLLAEIPYREDWPGKGLKEYLKGGKLKTKYPQIVVVPVDKMLKQSSYHLQLSLSEKLKNVEFYVGELDEGFLHKDLVRLAPRSKTGGFELDFFVPPGGFVMQKINIICKGTTLLGHPYVFEKKYNLAVENKGF